MKRRKTKSGGQAIVLVTLALFAMAGVMGLAVDLGYSFFVEKQAQAAADAAALGAVQEAVVRIRAGGGAVTGFTCASKGTGSTQVDCAARTSCASITSIQQPEQWLPVREEERIRLDREQFAPKRDP